MAGIATEANGRKSQRDRLGYEIQCTHSNNVIRQAVSAALGSRIARLVSSDGNYVNLSKVPSGARSTVRQIISRIC